MSDIKTETVDSVEAPPKARVETAVQTMERKKDYLEGFLAQKPAAPATGDAPGGDIYESVISAIKEIFDPEIPVNIYDLGLIYNVEINDGHALVSMTLTTPHCPVAESMPGEVEMRVAAVPGIMDAEVKLVWEPAWSPTNMTDEARLELGML
jgi:FeS assembly SUF system protein